MQQPASTELPLDYIFGLDRPPTLGEINWAINREVRRWQNDSYREEQLDAAWQKCDAVFLCRHDYRVWRHFFRRDYLHRDLLQPSELQEQVANWLNDPDETVVWGLLAVLAGLIAYSERVPLNVDARIALANPCESRVLNGLKPLRRGEAACAAVTVLVLDASQKVQHQQYETEGGPAAQDALKEYLKRLEHLLQQIDKTWKLGDALQLDEWSKKVKSRDAIVVAPFSVSDLALRLMPAMANTHRAIRTVVTEFGPDTQNLLGRAFLLAVSVWQTARFVRIRTQRWQSASDLEKRRRYEIRALYNATEAARDAGRYLESAGLAHILLRTIPDNWAPEEEYQKWGNNVAYSIRQAGLQVDDRFDPDNRQNAITHSERQENAPGWRGSRAFVARKKRDQRQALWAPIIKHCRSVGPDILRQVLCDARRGVCDRTTMRSGYLLNLQEGKIEDAVAILECFEPTPFDLFPLIRSINRTLQITPFGFDPKAHGKWHTLLRTQWSRLSQTIYGLTRDEAMVIHEVLLGRVASIVRNTRNEHSARVFARRYYDRLLDSIQIRQMYEQLRLVGGCGPETAIGNQVDTFWNRISGSTLGSPVFASVLGFGQQWGILTVGGKERWEYRWFPSDGEGSHTPEKVISYARVLQRGCASWLCDVKGVANRLNIPWGKELTDLADAIKEAANEVNPDAKWLMLAIEPDLAGLPWHHLFSMIGHYCPVKHSENVHQML